MHRHLLKIVIGVAIGVFFIWLSARDQPLDAVIGAVHFSGSHMVVGDGFVPTTPAGEHALLAASGWAMDLLWLLPYAAILVLIHFLRVVRYKPLLDPIVTLSLRDHNRIGAVGFMAMFLFPLRLGELVRPWLVKQASGGRGRMTEVLATVVVERVVDGLMVALLLFAILGALPTSDPAASEKLAIGAYAALAVFLAATFLLALAALRPDAARKLVRYTLGLVSKRAAGAVDALVATFLSGLRNLPSARDFIAFLALTAVYWALNGLGVWCMIEAFHLPIDGVGAYAMMACVVVGMMIPNSPGNAGSFWYFLLIPGALYGVALGSVQATAFGLAVWLMQLVQQTAFGAWFILRGKVSWRGVVAATHLDEAQLTEGERDVAAPPVITA